MIPVAVAVPLPVHGTFTYLAPTALPVGSAVWVPFGGRKVNGWVVGPGAPTTAELREVLEAGEPIFDEAMLRFYTWIADYYLAPLGEVIATANPTGARTSTRHVYRPTAAGVAAVAEAPPEGADLLVLRELIAHPELTRAGLERRLAAELDEVEGPLRRLRDRGLVEADDVEEEGPQDLEHWLVLTGDPATAGLTARQVKARALLAALAAQGEVLADGWEAATVRRLEKLGLVRREARARRSAAPAAAPTRGPPLNSAQSAVVEAVRPGVTLLHGVTGAGKTEVYLALAERTVARGEQVLVLVPEISLTPQLCGRFAARFPGKVAVLHSALTATERLREWRTISAGEVQVAVGARSAIFAPFQRLGLLVVDEENDDSYKQEDGVRYHARDLAVVRGRMAGCPVVLGSATPSLESWENARTQRYQLASIQHRATPRPVPELRIVDMRQHRVDGKEPLLAPEVLDAVRTAVAARGKAILLYNRRGYATFVECPGCGQAYDCPSCSIALVYHQRSGRLDCHYCGYYTRFQPDCPKCGTTLSVLGRGTERVEEALGELLPGVSIGRMDADTTRSRGSHARILDAFRAGETQILVGTQIVAKGHDFPDVHVAAALGVDHVLGQPDFRSAERTFALVTQLCGRAGRGDVPGRVFLQTHHPDHAVFGTIGDMAAFAEREGPFRRMLRYPPYTRLVLVRAEGTDRTATFAHLNHLAREQRAAARTVPGVDVLGPAPAPIPRVNGRWRYQLILRGRDVRAFRAFVEAHRPLWKAPQGVRLTVDVDPRSLA